MRPSPRNVTLGESEFTIKKKHLRYEDVAATHFTYGDPPHFIYILLKNGDEEVIAPGTPYKRSAQKLLDLYHEFLQRSFRYRWATYVERSAEGCLNYGKWAIHLDGQVIHEEKGPTGIIPRGATATFTPYEVKVGSILIPTRFDSDILWAMLEKHLDVKFQ